MDEIEQELEGQEPVETPESEEQGGEAPEPTTDPEIEAEARKYGWRPKEEFDRDPEGWVDAERFMELPSTHKKMLRDELRERDKKLEEYQQRMDRLEKTNKAALETALDQQKRAYEDKIQQLRAAQRRAVEEGDTERWERLEDYKSKLEPPKAPEFDEPQQPQEDPAVAQYASSPEGQWLQDPIMRDFAARAIDMDPKARMLDAQGQIQYAEQKVKEYFPHKFEQPRQQRQKVDGGGLAGGRSRNTASKLPPEAMKAAKEFVEMGVFKSVDDYAKQYFEQEG